MNKPNTYALLVGSEERNRNMVETVVYVLIAVSVLASIWQFADQPSGALPMNRVGATIKAGSPAGGVS